MIDCYLIRRHIRLKREYRLLEDQFFKQQKVMEELWKENRETAAHINYLRNTYEERIGKLSTELLRLRRDS